MSERAKHKKTQQLAESIKEWIVQKNLAVGDRLPSEIQMMVKFHASKSTVRESMRILEAQGLLTTKTGPKGGIFVNEMTEMKAQSLLSHYFFFKELSISDIYQIRQSLEPELVATLAGKLSKEQLDRLKLQTEKYQYKPENIEQEKMRHVHSIEFHSILASYTNNELLKFIMRFTAKLLTELTLYNKLYEPSNEKLWETGIKHHTDLIVALEKGQADQAREIMKNHMAIAHKIMALQEVEMKHKFLME